VGFYIKYIVKVSS